MQPFSDEWAVALREGINQHPYFPEAAAKWNLGPVALTARLDREDQEDVSIFFDIEHGICRYTMILSAKDAFRACDFILEGNLQTWEKVFNLEQTSVTAFLTGKLKLTKGSFYKTLGMEKASVCLFQAAASLK